MNLPGRISTSSTSQLSGQMKYPGGSLADLCEVMTGIAPFNPLPEKPGINGMTAFTGSIHRYMLERGAPGFIRYDRRLTDFRPLRCFKAPRILLALPDGGETLRCAFTDETFVTGPDVFSVLLHPGRYHPYYLMGILNSRTMGTLYRERYRGLTTPEHAADLPVPTVNFMNRHEKARHRALVAAVERLLYLLRERRSGKPDWANPVLDKQIGEADDRVEELVRDLFGLPQAPSTCFLPL
jgi:hypothetical protein